MRFQALSLTTPSANVAGADPATPPDYCFPCDVKYDYTPSGGGTIIDPITPPAPTGATLTVGTGQMYPNIASALSVAANGDRLLLTAETFTVPSPIGYAIASPGGVNTSTDTVTYTGGDCPTFSRVRFTTSGALPAPLVANTDYWTVRQSATSSKLATSVANALANVFVDLTTTGTGTQTMTVQALTVDKQITLQGASRAGTIIQSAGAGTDAVTLLTVQTSNFVIRDCTVKHKKTTNTSVETAISVIGYSNTSPLQTATGGSTTTMTVSGTPWITNQWVGAKVTFTTGSNAGQSRIVSSNTNNTLTFPALPNAVVSGDTYAVIPMNVYFENVAIENVEFAIVLRCDNWQINNCHLAYVGPNNSTRRLIGVYRSDGQGLFTNSTYDSGQNGVITGNCRVFCVLSTVGLPIETLGGYLRLGYITPSNSYPVQQFFNSEWFLPGATPLTFCVDNCNTLANSTATTIAAGSNGLALPQATINVADTSAFASSGSIVVVTSAGSQAVSYTGKTATSFTGCTLGTGTMSTGGSVTSSGETSAFIVWTQTQPTLSQCAQVNLQSNTLLNGHGKGAFALNGASGLGTAGSTTFYASSNTISLTGFLGTFATGITGSVNPSVLAQLGYDTTRWSNPNQSITVPAGLNGLFTVDGVTLLDGYRVFVDDNGNAVNSGIYSATSGAWYRTSDLKVGDDAAGVRFAVEQGNTYAGTNWVCTNSSPAIVGTAALSFSEYELGPSAPTYPTATGGTETTIIESGITYKVHTFTSSGTFTVTDPGTSAQVQYLIVGGGGAGGVGLVNPEQPGCGGNAGQMLTGTSAVAATAYAITVGDGGSGAVGAPNPAGGASSALGQTATGGSGGTSQNGPFAGTGASGGINGLQSSINGTATYYAGGGGPALFPPSNAAGLGGGGVGAVPNSLGNGGQAATANTGGGGGGGYGRADAPKSPRVGGDGGSGIVIIRYPVAA